MLTVQQYAWLVGSQYKPMELAKSDWDAIKKSPPWSIDSWGMGMSPSVSLDDILSDSNLVYMVECGTQEHFVIFASLVASYW